MSQPSMRVFCRTATRASKTVSQPLRSSKSNICSPKFTSSVSQGRQLFATWPSRRLACNGKDSSHLHPIPPTPPRRLPKLQPKRSSATGGSTLLLGLLGVPILGLFSFLQGPNHDNQHISEEEICKDTQILEQDNDGPSTSNNELPRYRLSEIKLHDSTHEQPWVILGNKVYDITDWIPAHPGGSVILRAAGSSIEPYWKIFTIHNSPYVREILEQYLIGEVHPADLNSSSESAIEDPFATDPQRDDRLMTLTQKPCNAETPPEALGESFLTPNELFYVRNHMWVPQVSDADAHEIRIELPSGDERTYTLGELRKNFQHHTITAVLQCSGNRRRDMTERSVHRKTNGLQWAAGAISCASWTGVKLRDVLTDAGLNPEDPDAVHVQFTGLEAYGASIPLSTAMDPRGDVLLAFEMNGETLPGDHGFPVRALVPGHVAARSVKWLNKIVVSDDESTTSWQRKDYKCFGPNEALGKLDWSKYKSIQEMPITSAITGARILPGEQGTTAASHTVVQLQGYAYSGGGHEIQRVDVSLDGGKTWDQAKLLQDASKGSKPWCWKGWRYETKLDAAAVAENKKTMFVVKATDDAYNTQPETYDSIYNLRGNLATAWHRVDVDLERRGEQIRSRKKEAVN